MEKSFGSNAHTFQLAKIPKNTDSFKQYKKNNKFIVSQHNLLDNNLNIISCSRINASEKIRDISNIISFNDNNKTITESKNENIFLGKKKKIHFDVIKNSLKNLHLQNYYLDNISSNNSKDDNNIRDSQNNKEIEKAENSEIEQEKAKNIKSFNRIKLFHIDNYPKEKLNRGIWSSDEHIKFIKAFVYFGKDYKRIQKYISSRDPIQIRTHAQKFFIRLKRIKNNEYDFTDDKIKNLSDIFNIIERNNKTNMDNKEYIINTLITLCQKNLNLKHKEIKLKKEKKNIDILFLDYKNNINNENNIDEKGKINKENKTNSNIIIDDENQKGLYPEEICIKNIIERNNENIEQKKDILEQEKYLEYSYIYNILNNNFGEYNPLY